MNKDKLNLSVLIRSNRGFSLVEIIVAMTVLLIVIFAFSTIFTFAFGGIFSQGRKSEALYEVQKDLEALYEAQESGDGNTLEIRFDSADDVSVDGEEVEQNYTYEEDKTGIIYTFIPNKQ